MSLPNINNLKFTSVNDDVILVHQKKAEGPGPFTICDGLLILPKEGRNSQTIVLDLNIEPKYIDIVNNEFGPISNYVCTHGHVDHSAHVYYWEKLGASIHAPNPEAKLLYDITNFFDLFWSGEIDISFIKRFGELSGFNPCKKVKSFEPGSWLKFENFEVETLHFKGHSPSHIGFLFHNEKIIHISCLGFDQPKPGIDGFGPWYGFKQCFLADYLRDISRAEELFLEHANYLTSSHSYIVKNPDTTPFEYMRRKISEHQLLIDNALKKLKPSPRTKEEAFNQLVKLDLFFPKSKMKGFLVEIYTVWESWLIGKHLEEKF